MTKRKNRVHVLPAAFVAAGIFLSTATVGPVAADPVSSVQAEPIKPASSIQADATKSDRSAEVDYINSFQEDNEPSAASGIELNADYTADVYAFDHFDESKVRVRARSSDGNIWDIHDFTCEHVPSILKIRTVITVHTAYGDCVLEIIPIPLKTIEASYQGSVYYGEPLYLENVSASRVYEDGRSFRISNIACSVVSESVCETLLYV